MKSMDDLGIIILVAILAALCVFLWLKWIDTDRKLTIALKRLKYMNEMIEERSGDKILEIQEFDEMGRKKL